MNWQPQPTESMWYYASAGQTIGPVPLSVVQQLVASGQLGPDDVVRNVSWPNWFRVADALSTLGLTQLPTSPPPMTPPGTDPIGQPATDQTTQPAPTHSPSTPQPNTALTPPAATQPAATAGFQAPASFAATAQPTAFQQPAPSSTEGAASPVASFARRSASWLIDSVVLIGALVLTNNWLGSFAPVASLAMVGFYGVYIVLLPAHGVGTLGHLVLGLRVVDAETGAPAEAGSMYARGLMMFVFAVPLLVGVVASIVTAATGPVTSAWHDVATNTAVWVKPR